MESEQDLFPHHGLNAENELMTALGDEIGREIDRDIIAKLFAFAGAGNVTWHSTVPGSGAYSLIDPRAYNRTIMKRAIALLVVLVGLAAPLQAKEKQWDIPCQKVFVTGIQAHEIAWALKGEGVENNLYKHTCMTPVSNVDDADAILDLELDQRMAGQMERRIQAREAALSSPDFWVSCSSSLRGSYCFDSRGYSLETYCNVSGCSSYYGPNPGIVLMQAIGDVLMAKLEASSAWAYMFTVKDHKLIWKFEGYSPWHSDLAKYSQCPKKAGTYGQVCKKPAR